MLYFADDSSLHCSHSPDNLHTIELELQNDLNAIYDYDRRWAITFNSNKTTQQAFTSKRNTQAPKLTFGGLPIPITSEHKQLGLIFSTDLKFKNQVNSVLLKFNRTMSPLYGIAPYVPRKILLELYTLYVRPHIDYCDTVYDGNITAFDRKTLEKDQNRAARLITGTSQRTSTDGLMIELRWSRLADRRRIH